MNIMKDELESVFPEFIGEMKEDHITGVYSDSREQGEGKLFVPIKGDNFDAHHYINQVIENGASATLWDKSYPVPEVETNNFCFFLVDDTVKALQMLAKYYREKINPIVIGITGSNGKTTTKDLVAAVLAEKYVTHATKGNFNNHLGLPFTILEMSEDTEVLVVEMGMSDFKEIELLTKIATPNYGVITNIGESHIEQLGSIAGVTEAKLEIITGLQAGGKLIIDGDEAQLAQIKEADYVVSCGFDKSNDVEITATEVHVDHTTFTLNEEQFYTVPLLGRHHAKNACYAITIGQMLKLTTDEIRRGLVNLAHTAMRFELLVGKNNVTMINDAYNASPTSMKAAINVVKEMTGFKEKVLVLGDILELGEFSEYFHKSIAEVITDPITILYTFGSAAKHISTEVNKRNEGIITEHFEDERTLIKTLEKSTQKGNLILFKASRGMAFEQLVTSIS